MKRLILTLALISPLAITSHAATAHTLGERSFVPAAKSGIALATAPAASKKLRAMDMSQPMKTEIPIRFRNSRRTSVLYCCCIF